MLHPSKSRAILQWYNSLVRTKVSVQSFSEFADGIHFQNIIATIHDYWSYEGNISSELISNEERSLTISVSDNEIPADNVSKCENESLDASLFTEKTRSKKKNVPLEVQKRYEEIRKFIDEICNMDSTLLISYADCASGKEVELAKITILLLSNLVPKLLNANDEMVFTATMLESYVQEEIKECLAFALWEKSSSENSLKKAEFNKLLSLPAKCKASPRRRTSNVTEELHNTPKELPKKRRDRILTVPNEDIFDSPLKTLLESPQMRRQADMDQQEKIKKLTNVLKKFRNALHDEEIKVEDLTSEMKTLNDKLEKKDKDNALLKEEIRKVHESVDELENAKHLKSEEEKSEREKCQEEFQNYKEEIKHLKEENSSLLQTVTELENKSSETVEHSSMPETIALLDTLRQLEQNNNVKDEQLAEFKSTINTLTEDLQSYKQMYEETVAQKIKSPEVFSPCVPETMSNILRADEQFTQNLLEEKEKECIYLKQKVLEEIENTKRYQTIARDVKDELAQNTLSQNQAIRSYKIKAFNLLTDLQAAKKTITSYEISAKEDLQKPEVSSVGVSPISSSTMFESKTDKPAKTENTESPNIGKLWGQYTATPRITRRTSSETHKLDFDAADTTSSTSSDFSKLKKTVLNVVQLVNQISGCKNDRQQSESLGSIMDVCSLLEGVGAFLKLHASTVAPSEPQVRTTRGRPTAATTWIAKNKVLEEQVATLKKEVSIAKLDNELQMEKNKEVQGKFKKLQNSNEELRKALEISQGETMNANYKTADAKKLMENMSKENKKLIEVCHRLKNKLEVSKNKACDVCDSLRRKLELYQEDICNCEKKKDEYKYFMKTSEEKIANLNLLLQKEKQKSAEIEFKSRQERAYASGSQGDRNAVLMHYFQKGIAESREAQKKAAKDGPKQIVSFNTYIYKPEKEDDSNESTMSAFHGANASMSTVANKSFKSDDEEDFLNYNSLAHIHRETFPDLDIDPEERLQEIKRRNTLCLPHLQSSYPLEIQDMTPTENKYYDSRRSSLHLRSQFFSTRDSTMRKRKKCEEEDQARKVPRTSFQRPQIPKPPTPVRKTGTISKTFKTPSSIRRMMRLKNKFN